MLDVTIEKSAIHIGQRFAVSFQRTLRIPDDGRTYPLPPGLGVFPIYQVEDYQDKLPQAWRETGGAFIPMYQREALWLGFRGASWKPNALKIAIGGINAISGQPHDPILHDNPQDYLVIPNQPWLDGIKTGQGSVRQFVAMPLGLGYTVEAALTGQETYGGIQIIVFEPKPGRFPDAPPPESELGPQMARSLGSKSTPSMGLGAGGVMKQKIYPDSYGIEVWNQENCGSVTVHILNSAQYRSITGQEPPPTPIDAATYTKYQLPWFDLYDEEKGALTPSEQLANVKTVTKHDAELGLSAGEQASFDVPETQIKKLREEETRATDFD
ncbi:MAG: hypothetical protein ACRDEA_05405 [Microcystaceae cyanobacterium]